MLMVTLLLQIAGYCTDLAQVLRWNIALGIDDVLFVLIGSTTINAFFVAFFILVPQIVIAKITPSHVEASVFSFSASIFNASNLIGSFTGTLWN